MRLEELAPYHGSNGRYLPVFAHLLNHAHDHYEWAVLDAHLAATDPPVVVSHDRKPFEPSAELLSALLTAKVIEGAIYAATQSDRETHIGNLALNVQGAYFESRSTHLLDRYGTLPLPPLLISDWTSAIEWWGDEDTIVAFCRAGSLGGAIARSNAAWERFRETAGVTLMD